MSTEESSQTLDITLTSTEFGVVVYANRRLLNGNEPRIAAARRLPSVASPQTLYVVLSPLLGCGLTAFAANLPPSSALILVEFQRDLARLCSHRESEIPTLLSRRIRFAENISEASEQLRRIILERGIRSVQTINFSGGTRFCADTYRRFTDHAMSEVQQFWKNRGTVIRLGRRWISNMARNAVCPHQPLNALQPHLRSTVVLCGAGPSLDRHLSWLRTAGDSVSLVALDTALPALAAADLKPDVVWSMDGQLANAFDLVPWRWDHCLLAADLTVHPSIVRRFDSRRRFFFVSNFAEPLPLGDTLLQGIPRLAPRGSVAPSALEGLVRFCGASTIVTAGLDFWYHLPKTHAAMTAPHRRLLRGCDRLHLADGDPRGLLRPFVEVSRQDGSRARGDAVLVDQAQQLRWLIRELTASADGLRLLALPGDGLDLGIKLYPGSPTGSTLSGSPAPLHPPGEAVFEGAARVEALTTLVDQLRLQEELLDDPAREALFLNADLRFVLFDLPQWPLIELRQEWVQQHRLSILRSVRDYRRRFERALRAAPTLRSIRN